MNLSQHKPIFIVGVPRSGTTWVSNIIGAADSVSLLTEPDNEKYSFTARLWKNSHYRFPSNYSPESTQSLIHFYSQIFKGHFPKNRSLINHLLNHLTFIDKKSNETHIKDKEMYLRDDIPHYEFYSNITKFLYFLSSSPFSFKNRLVIKSVHAGLILPLLYAQFQPDMLLIFRHPANVIASCIELNIEDANRSIFTRPDMAKLLKQYEDKISQLNDPLSFMGFQVGLFYFLWEQHLENNQNWFQISHEELCIDSVEKFKSIYSNFNLEWHSKIGSLINKLNRPGVGFKTHRSVDGLIDKWKKKLNKDQIIKIQKGYSILPVKHYEEFKF